MNRFRFLLLICLSSVGVFCILYALARIEVQKLVQLSALEEAMSCAMLRAESGLMPQLDCSLDPDG